MTAKNGGHIDTETQRGPKHTIGLFLIKLFWPLADRGLRNPKSPCKIVLSSAKKADCFRLTHKQKYSTLYFYGQARFIFWQVRLTYV